MFTIGYISSGYPEKRCILNKINRPDVQYKKLKNYGKYYYYILARMTHKNPKSFLFKSRSRNFDILHTFNTVCITKKTWIATFETMIPRRNEILQYHHENSEYTITKEVKRDIEEISKDNCKAIIALSECNKNIQKEFLKNFSEDIQEKINKKLIVIHPPQDLLITEEEIVEKFKTIESEIKFLFIGNEFFRKGGYEVVNSINKLKNQYNIKVSLTIVSNLLRSDYGMHSDEEKDFTEKFIKDNSDWIKLYQGIPNDKVLELARESHVGFLPTIADTYGYSVLELQAAGVPVVTTDIYEKQFSENSYGFRPGRSAEKAVIKALEYLNDGNEWIVDIDLERFFDTVDQDRLINIIMRTIKDGDVVSLIRKYLSAGVMDKGVTRVTEKGTPQ